MDLNLEMSLHCLSGQYNLLVEEVVMRGEQTKDSMHFVITITPKHIQSNSKIYANEEETLIVMFLLINTH